MKCYKIYQRSQLPLFLGIKIFHRDEPKRKNRAGAHPGHLRRLFVGGEKTIVVFAKKHRERSPEFGNALFSRCLTARILTFYEVITMGSPFINHSVESGEGLRSTCLHTLFRRRFGECRLVPTRLIPLPKNRFFNLTARFWGHWLHLF